ncbi:MAG: glucose-6-phosphate isomerase [Bacteroidetes bacterium]|nr:glucose-6-phosphate isomerase [Bacteroidota bacterium]
MINLRLNIDKTSGFVSKDEIKLFRSEIELHYQNIYNKTGKGNEFLGWATLPEEISSSIIDNIEKDAAILSKISEVVVVIGIGGSYLGSKAVIDALSNNFPQLSKTSERINPIVLFAGQNIDEDYMHDLLSVLDKKDYSIIVISKSGTTTEPAIAFRILKKHIEKKYGKSNARERIIAVTDKSRGALKKLSDAEGYTTYVIPDDVGGRYSVLTPVGLLPIAVAGFDIRKLVEGAKNMQHYLREEKDLEKNPAALYAVVRNILYRKGKTIEIMANFTPVMANLTEWWKQLYGESEGKENKGIFPAGVNFTCDLHSMGQYIQQGLRNIFETVISIEQPRSKIEIPNDPENIDGLNFLSGKRYSFVNKMAEQGTLLAHVDGGVPNICIILPQINEQNLGELIYFFEIGCALSGYILDVNPFDQPGVEDYKKNMFALLGKPGYEELARELKSRL